MFSILWFIVIIGVIIHIKKNQKGQQKLQEEYSQKFSSSKKEKLNSSYYSNNKVMQYRKMNENHIDHQELESDFVNDIGYKRCPQCDTMVSKKSDTCFMCNHSFLEH